MPSVTELERTLVTSFAKFVLSPMLPTTSMFDPLFASATTSLPLKSRLPLVWWAFAKIAALALLWATTYTSPAASVPFNAMDFGDVPPLT